MFRSIASCNIGNNNKLLLLFGLFLYGICNLRTFDKIRYKWIFPLLVLARVTLSTLLNVTIKSNFILENADIDFPKEIAVSFPYSQHSLKSA